MKTVKIVTITALVALTLPAAAQTESTRRIDQRQENQANRIEQGQKSGALNEREARRLERGQERVQRMENKAAADGKVTAKERRRIERAQNHESRKIYREKHDRQTAR